MTDPLQKFPSFISRTIHIGNLALGGLNPVRIQSMTSTNTLNTKETVDQSIRMIDAGCEMVRITCPGIKEAENLRIIKKELQYAGYTTPLIADIHFNPNVAEHAARIVEKIRINPGNYTGTISKNLTGLSEFEYQLELEKAADKLLPLLKICKEYGTVIRVGVNHGSLSERIIHKYGNTPAGMVASALEFIQICQAFQFRNLVLSMKSSNIKIMVQAYRLLASKMVENDMDYPLHLGVTEAGNGLDGRIKSTAGIGTLIQEGIGDTIRVSLTEAPENEIIFAKSMLKVLGKPGQNNINIPEYLSTINPYEYHRRKTHPVAQIGGGKPPVVISSSQNEEADLIFSKAQNLLVGKQNNFKIIRIEECVKYQISENQNNFIELNLPVDPKSFALILDRITTDDIILFSASRDQEIIEVRKLISSLLNREIKNPVVIKKTYEDENYDELIVHTSADFGSLLIDGLIDGVWIESLKHEDKSTLLSFRILQASGSRISSTEFIACPSCGRTKYNIEQAFEDVKKATDHLCGLKIAVMGCIVNGPGEMADADYGYIGAGNGKVNLYKSRDLIKQGIDEKQAVAELIALIKKYGDWKEKN